MKNAIILHGTESKDEYYSLEYPAASNFHWLAWLQKQLIVRDIKADNPEVYHNYSLNYDVWRKEFERFDIGPETILVGHSCGGGFIVRWLSENKDKSVGRVVLVAPWLDPEKTKEPEFFEFAIDPDLVKRTEGVTIFSSTNDDTDVSDSVKILFEEIKDVKCVEFENYGHFCFGDMKTDEFPELLKEVLLQT